MKVKVNDQIYDSEEMPIMVILNKEERKQICNMHPDSEGKYCQYPDTKYWGKDNYKNIKEWMKNVS